MKHFMATHGIAVNKVEAHELIRDEFLSIRDREPGEVYYYYDGPDDHKTREFCKYILKLNKLFSTDDIQFMSDRLGYDVKKYKGAYNCRHRWVAFRGKYLIGTAPTNRQINSLIEKNILY